MLATWGERLSIGLGGRGQVAWRLRQRVDKDCMGELATGSLFSCTGNRMSRAWGWHMSTPMPQVAWVCAHQGQHARQRAYAKAPCLSKALSRGTMPRHALGRGIVPRYALGEGTLPRQGTRQRHHG